MELNKVLTTLKTHPVETFQTEKQREKKNEKKKMETEYPRAMAPATKDVTLV